ncbi:MAG TPA: alpha/beta fold hydrolase [Anaerolineales bacterium]|nr:alpha/beta fold hydrolase [Anaerolineales bacterium]
MASKQLSLHHLIQFPTSRQSTDADSLHPTILALHGRGSHEEDLIGLASYLPSDLLWISPRAPLPVGPNSFEWYRVRVIGRPEPEHVMAALGTIDHFINEIFSTYPIDPRKFFLLGFSQGSILSMCYTLQHPSRIAGVIAQSGYIPNGMDLEIDEAGIKNKPFLLTHGLQDTMIPVDWGRRSRDLLQKLGVDPTYYELQMGHEVSTESLSVIATWLTEQLRK